MADGRKRAKPNTGDKQKFKPKSTVVALQDGGGQKPHYSMRTLCRSLEAARRLCSLGYTVKRALYEGCAMNFATQLDGKGKEAVEALLMGSMVRGLKAKDLNRRTNRPGGIGEKYGKLEEVETFWLRSGPQPKDDWAMTAADKAIEARKLEGQERAGDKRKQTACDAAFDAVKDDTAKDAASRVRFVLTDSVRTNLRALARAVSAGRGYPLLLQGPTSSGKTTIVEYLAARLGHRCMRVNNHEHTELSEYMVRHLREKEWYIRESRSRKARLDTTYPLAVKVASQC
jgi:midasin